jgi:hypothetical protein
MESRQLAKEDKTNERRRIFMKTRIMHQVEKQYLTVDAQSLIYRFILEGELDNSSAEDVLSQVVAIGSSKNSPLDEIQLMDLISQMHESDLFTSGFQAWQNDGSRYLKN